MKAVFHILAATALTLVSGAGGAAADSAPAPGDLSSFSDPEGVVLAVRTPAGAAGGDVRLAVYDGEDAFLERAAIKHHGTVDKSGVAAIPLYGLAPGAYAFVAYYDRNGDGKLNRGALGAPTEPVAFSNGVKPKLRKPRFDETKVEVAPGAVVLIDLKD